MPRDGDLRTFAAHFSEEAVASLVSIIRDNRAPANARERAASDLLAYGSGRKGPIPLADQVAELNHYDREELFLAIFSYWQQHGPPPFMRALMLDEADEELNNAVSGSEGLNDAHHLTPRRRRVRLNEPLESLNDSENSEFNSEFPRRPRRAPLPDDDDEIDPFADDDADDDWLEPEPARVVAVSPNSPPHYPAGRWSGSAPARRLVSEVLPTENLQAAFSMSRRPSQ